MRFKVSLPISHLPFVYQDHVSVAAALLVAGADIHLAPPSRRSALIVAADCDSHRVMRLLVSRGIDVNEVGLGLERRNLSLVPM